MHKYEDIAVEIRGAVAQITINRPHRLNALRMTISDREIVAALAALARDESVRAIILTGAGERAFCTGWDMEEIEDTPLDKLEAMVRTNLEMFFAIWYQRQPVIAAINGYAAGTGSGLALACDLAIAADNARLGEPEIRHGALSPFLMLPFLTHSRAVHEIYYTGDLVPAADLYRLGIVNRVVPAADLMAEAKKVALRMARLPAIAMKQNKEAINRAYDMRGLVGNIEYGQEMFCLTSLAQSPEGMEFRKIAREQGLKAAIKWRDERFK